MLLCACIKNGVRLKISPKYTDIDTMPVYFVFVFLALEIADIGCALLEIGHNYVETAKMLLSSVKQTSSLLCFTTHRILP